MRRTKIVCTLGPASSDAAILAAMLRAGMNVARFNFSHGTREEHWARMEALREASAVTGIPVAVLLDTEGPELRLGRLFEEPLRLEPGREVVLVPEGEPLDRYVLPVNYPRLAEEVRPGDLILLADGLVALRVMEAAEGRVRCLVCDGGEITSRKGVNVPGAELSLPALTEKDREDLVFGVRHGIDFVAVSFVRRASDVLAVRQVLEELEADVDIIAKIENREGVERIDEIIKVADGIMVARGDLGVEIPAEDVPLVQKMIIEKCNRAGKPVITATQMLESMIHHPRPTRAEASDVANAILDGTDAVMLSGETAVGRYPVEAVETMARIVCRAESAIRYEEILARRAQGPARTVTDAISHATCAAARDLGAAAIVTSTQTGYTARMVAKYRPRAPIVAATPRPEVRRKLLLVWGVQPVLVPQIDDTDGMVAAALDAGLAAGLIKGGDLVVITAGVPVGVHGTTNMLRVHTVGNVLARGTGIGARAVTGRARVARTVREALEKVQPGDILVAVATDRDFMPAIERAGGIVTEEGGLTSHAAIVGLEFGIPVIVGVDGATAILPDGEVITIDGQRGLIYGGTARVL
jgi:pyruvate kinase